MCSMVFLTYANVLINHETGALLSTVTQFVQTIMN